MDDDIGVQKRNHCFQETPCVVCGYIYKSLEDYHHHLKMHDLQRKSNVEDASRLKIGYQVTPCDFSGLKSVEQPFDSPEISPAETKTFNFDEHQFVADPQCSISNSTANSKINSDKTHHAISTPPLTPRSNGTDVKLLNVDQEKREADQKHVSMLKDEELTLIQANHQKLSIVQPAKHKTKDKQTILNNRLSSLDQMLHVDIADEPSKNEKSCKTLTSVTQTTQQLLKVATTESNSLSSLKKQSKANSQQFTTSAFASLPSSSVPRNTTSKVGTLKENTRPPPPPYFDNNFASTYPSTTERAFGTSKDSCFTWDVDKTKINTGTYTVDEGVSITGIKRNTSDMYNQRSPLELHSQQLANTVPFLYQQPINVPVQHGFNQCNTVQFSQTGYQHHYQGHYSQDPQMIGQDVYRYNLPSHISQSSTTHINHASTQMQTISHNHQQLHPLQQLHCIQQMQQQQISNWSVLNQHVSSFPSDSSIPPQMSQSHSVPVVGQRANFSGLPPPMLYGNLATAAAPTPHRGQGLQEPFAKRYQSNKTIQHSLHPLNPLIQQVQSIVQKNSRQAMNYPISSSSSGFFRTNPLATGPLQHPHPPSKTCGCNNCLLAMSRAKHQTSTPTISNCHGKSGGKRKRVQEKENLNAQQLAEMRNMEWEKREGYKCKVCDVRFQNQQILIDHLSDNKCKRKSAEEAKET